MAGCTQPYWLSPKGADLIQYAQVTPCAPGGPGQVPLRPPRRVRVGDPAMFARWALEESWHGTCTSPVALQLMSNYVNAVSGEKGVHTCRATVRCRKCPECRQFAARCWMARAISEASIAPKTWFATFTFDWKTRPCQTESQWPYARRQFTLFLKRLRKLGCGLRYLAVFEAHADGRPHIHCLLHAKVGSPLLWRHVDKAWIDGFHKTKLCGDSVGSARYVTKYLFKDGSKCRVRASIKYGAQRKDAATDAEHLLGPQNQLGPDTPHTPLTTTWLSRQPHADFLASVASNSAFLTRSLRPCVWTDP